MTRKLLGWSGSGRSDQVGKPVSCNRNLAGLVGKAGSSEKKGSLGIEQAATVGRKGKMVGLVGS